MKKSILVVFITLTSISHAGPPDAESIGLSPSGFIEVSDESMGQVFRESISLVSAFVPREMRSKCEQTMEPVGWFDENKNLCQLRCGGKISKALFERCMQKGKWKTIKTPDHYLSALHTGAGAVHCYDGVLDGCIADLVWIEAGEVFMIVAELRKPIQSSTAQRP